MTPVLWDEAQTAKEIGITLATLRNWRSQGRGPAYLKLGKRRAYLPEDVESWMLEQRATPKAKP